MLAFEQAGSGTQSTLPLFATPIDFEQEDAAIARQLQAFIRGCEKLLRDGLVESEEVSEGSEEGVEEEGEGGGGVNEESDGRGGGGLSDVALGKQRQR